MKGVAALLGACTFVLALVPVRAEAQDGMGLAGIHEWVRVGRKICMATHFHDGTGSGRTKAEAQAAAIRAWTDFTAWEYGSRWGRWQLSETKRGSCTKDANGFTCSVSSRPCRL